MALLKLLKYRFLQVIQCVQIRTDKCFFSRARKPACWWGSLKKSRRTQRGQKISGYKHSLANRTGTEVESQERGREAHFIYVYKSFRQRSRALQARYQHRSSSGMMLVLHKSQVLSADSLLSSIIDNTHTHTHSTKSTAEHTVLQVLELWRHSWGKIRLIRWLIRPTGVKSNIKRRIFCWKILSSLLCLFRTSTFLPVWTVSFYFWQVVCSHDSCD